jgi:TolB protein
MNTFGTMTARVLWGSIPLCILALSACPSRIVFESTRAIDGTDARNGYNIWRVNDEFNGTGPTSVTKTVHVFDRNPSWSPGGTQIVFSSDRALDGTDAPIFSGVPVENIWRISASGTDPTPLTKAVNVFSALPSWSPDGTQIVFLSNGAFDGTDAQNKHGEPNIWRVDADGTTRKPLTKLLNAGSTDPSWSPDGTQILFSSWRALDGRDAENGNAPPGTSAVGVNIWRMNADGTGPTSVTKLVNAYSYQASWSPDGGQIVFSSNRALDGTDAKNKNDTLNIWRVNADGTNPTPVTRSVNAKNSEPRWSPDGNQLVFSSNRALDGKDAQNLNNILNIWRVNPDGTNPTPVTKSVNANSKNPTWSPDRPQIVFSSNHALDQPDAQILAYNIWLVNDDGTGLTPLTKTTARDADSVRPEFYRPVSPKGLNRCGGHNQLFALPGNSCQVAKQCGRWRCLGTEQVTCDTSQSSHNVCGGCAPLPSPGSGRQPGDPCFTLNNLDGIVVCAKGGNSLICCPFGTAGIGCGQGRD